MCMICETQDCGNSSNPGNENSLIGCDICDIIFHVVMFLGTIENRREAKSGYHVRYFKIYSPMQRECRLHFCQL